MNEPGEGFLGLENLNETPKHQALKKGPTPTPIQGLRLGTGMAQTVENWNFGAMGPSKAGTATIDPAGRSVWADPSTEVDGVNERWGWKRDPSWELGTCIWAQHGVWDPESGYTLMPDYFLYVKPDPLDSEKVPGRKVDFVANFWRPFWRNYARRIRQAQPEAIFFVQPPVFVQPAPMEVDDLQGRAAYSAHYYDGKDSLVGVIQSLMCHFCRVDTHDSTLELVQRRRPWPAAREVQHDHRGRQDWARGNPGVFALAARHPQR